MPESRSAALARKRKGEADDKRQRREKDLQEADQAMADIDAVLNEYEEMTKHAS